MKSLVGIAVSMLLLTGHVSLAGDDDEQIADLVDAARNMERGIIGIPIQWFEMESLVGWEKMMLIFGYADNANV